MKCKVIEKLVMERGAIECETIARSRTREYARKPFIRKYLSEDVTEKFSLFPRAKNQV